MATTAVEHVDEATPGTAVAMVNRSKPTLLRPIATPQEVMAVQQEQRAFIKAALVEGKHYGTFPGVDKKSLFKAGAEVTCAGFGLMPRYRIVEKEVDHARETPWRKVKNKYRWEGNEKKEKIGEEITEGFSLGLYRYVVECELVNRETGEVVGSAIGSCSTMESKYIDRPRDSENTILQMAEKRAFVASTRTTFGLTDEFTQDIEDNPEAFNRGTAAAASTGGNGARAASSTPAPACPKCGGGMWDNRPKKASGEFKANAPDFKCKDRTCDGKVWPEKDGAKKKAASAPAPVPAREPGDEPLEDACPHGVPFGTVCADCANED